MIILRAIKQQNNNIKTTTSNMTSVLINLRNEYIELNREVMSGTRIGGKLYNTCLNEINKTETGLNDDMLWETYYEKIETDEIKKWIEENPEEIKSLRRKEISRLLAIPSTDFETFIMTDGETWEDFEVNEKQIKIEETSWGKYDIALVKDSGKIPKRT